MSDFKDALLQVIAMDNLDDVPSVYTNIANVRATPEEIIITLGQRSIENPQEGKAVIHIYSSHWHAKRLAVAILDSIGKLEQIFGEIPLDRQDEIDPEVLKGLRGEHDSSEESNNS